MSAKLAPLAVQEVAQNAGMTHMAVITADDLTEATANTAQTLTLATIPAGCFVMKSELRLVKAFEDASDAAFNSSTASLGDTAAVDTHIAAKELNKNGTEIVIPYVNNTPVGAYTAANPLKLVVNSMAAKSLSNIDVGELHVLVQIFNPKNLSDVKRLSPITK